MKASQKLNPHFRLPAPPFARRARLLVGLSGGSDSTALLSLLLEAGSLQGVALEAAHVNYHLRGRESIRDEVFVKALCKKLKVPLNVLRLKNARAAALGQKKSLQDWARERRYAFFAKLCGERHAWGVAVAHHADDQAETVMDRILRGAGSRGLTGLRPVQELQFSKPDARLKIWRPLLSFSREELKKHLVSRGLAWREDRSNRKSDYRRNQIRHKVLPFLSRWNPRISQTLSKIGEIAAAQDAFLAQSLHELKKRMKRRFSPSAGYRGLKSEFVAMPLALQRLWVREVVESLAPNARGLSFERLEDALCVWKGLKKGPCDLGHGLSADCQGLEVFMRVPSKKGPVKPFNARRA
jgi:tRNA(Ile)-lysidine synthase